MSNNSFKKSRRLAFTLIEFLISVAICLVLMAGLYFAVDIQTRSTKLGRTIVEEAMLARSVLDLVARDVEISVTLMQPYRFRKGAIAYASSSAADSTSAATDSSGSSTGGVGDSSATGSGASSSTSTSGSSGSGASSSTSTSDSSGANEEKTESLLGPALIPPGLVGFPANLNLYVRKQAGASENSRPVGGIQRVSYQMLPEDKQGVGGLGRWQADLALTETGLNPDSQISTDDFELVAPEVRAIRFQYHAGDGGDWTSQWDSRTTGTDELTPQGPPRAVRIEVDIQVEANGPVQTFYRVVPIPVGNTPALAPVVAASS